MRWIKITENFGQVTVETSSGVRTTGASVESALNKMFVFEKPTDDAFAIIARLFTAIPSTADPSQIGSGVASA